MVVLHTQRCIHCGACRQYCPIKGAIVSERGRMRIDRQRCINCGKCIKSCYMRAIEKVPDNARA